MSDIGRRTLDAETGKQRSGTFHSHCLVLTNCHAYTHYCHSIQYSSMDKLDVLSGVSIDISKVNRHRTDIRTLPDAENT